MMGVLLALPLCGLLHAAPIGIANHNPGNIRSLHPWLWRGAIGKDARDHLIFRDDLTGLLAMKKILRAYYFQHHLVNVSSIVDRWVGHPKTAAQVAEETGYLLAVAQRAGVAPNERLWLEDHRMMSNLARAIIYAENGEQPYPASLYRQAFGY